MIKFSKQYPSGLAKHYIFKTVNIPEGELAPNSLFNPPTPHWRCRKYYN